MKGLVHLGLYDSNILNELVSSIKAAITAGLAVTIGMKHDVKRALSTSFEMLDF